MIYIFNCISYLGNRPPPTAPAGDLGLGPCATGFAQERRHLLERSAIAPDEAGRARAESTNPLTADPSRGVGNRDFPRSIFRGGALAQQSVRAAKGSPGAHLRWEARPYLHLPSVGHLAASASAQPSHDHWWLSAKPERPDQQSHVSSCVMAGVLRQLDTVTARLRLEAWPTAGYGKVSTCGRLVFRSERVPEPEGPEGEPRDPAARGRP